MSDGMLLKPIKRVRLYENAVEQIQSLILRKHYKPGDRLPSVNLSISSRLQMEQDSFIKLWQVRKILEVGMVGFLPKRTTEPFLKSLWHCIEEMEKNIDDQDAFISSGIRFHRLIAEAGKNEILILIWDTLGNFIRKSHDKIYRISRSPKRSLLAHKGIYSALKKRSVRKAVEAMKKHMDEEEQALL